MSDRLARLFRIVTLIQSTPGVTAKELAERCETTERTIYRDLEILSKAGIPFSSMGRGRGYQFQSHFSLYPLDWTDEEALAFSMLPSVMNQLKDLLPKEFLSAYEKVMAVYYKEKKRRQDIITQMMDVIQMGTIALNQERENHMLIPIVESILKQKRIQAVYHTQSRNETSLRLIDPYYLIPREFRLYLLGFCHIKNGMRIFRVSRFKEINVLEEKFEKNEFNVRRYMENTWSIERGDDMIPFKVRFSPDVARYVKEEEFYLSPKMTDLEDGSLLFEVVVNKDQEFLRWLYQYGPKAEILEPAYYREKMQDFLRSWAAHYEGAGTLQDKGEG
ncbi:MAG: WYL domain-containing protein [Thermicanus sp.]|nr:WYL domain-containing protein [Thermicanus sp.]